jgi:hypothetical protein
VGHPFGYRLSAIGSIKSKTSCKNKTNTKDPSTPVSRAEENAREPSSAQDDTYLVGNLPCE